MPKSTEELLAFLDQCGIAHKTTAHKPLFTVEDGRDVWHNVAGLHCKNLFLKDKKDKIWLVVMPGDKRADIGAIEKKIGAARLSFAKPDMLLEVLGLTPGSVTPFGLINDTQKRVTLVIDDALLAAEEVNFHPLHNSASTTISAQDLLKFAARLGYEPIILTPAVGAP